MRSFSFDPNARAPIVTALITGPKGTRKVRLILDTGAEMTQLHTARMGEVGYTPSLASEQASVVGVGGVEGSGYLVALQKLFVLGAKAEDIQVGVFDMHHLNGRQIDGLLGWDVIRAFHLEMNGPKGVLNVF